MGSERLNDKLKYTADTQWIHNLKSFCLIPKLTHLPWLLMPPRKGENFEALM